MAVTKRFTDQIVVMQTPEMGAEIRRIAEQSKVSVAQVARDAQALGLPMLEAHYERHGLGSIDVAPALPRRKRERIPTAQFRAPVAAA